MKVDKYYKIIHLPVRLLEELRVASALNGLTAKAAFDLLMRPSAELSMEPRGYLKGLVLNGMAKVSDNEIDNSEDLVDYGLFISEKNKIYIDDISRVMGLQVCMVGNMVLQGLSGNMDEALQEKIRIYSKDPA